MRSSGPHSTFSSERWELLVQSGLRMARQNLGAPLNFGIMIPNESPKMCEGDDLMSQRPIDMADSGFVRFQIQNHDLPETIWHCSVLHQFRCRHPLSPAVAGRASLRCPRKHASEQRAASSAAVPFDQRMTSEPTATSDRHPLYGGRCRNRVRVKFVVHSKPPAGGCELK